MKLQDLNSITSKEIAELTGKRHDNVLRDIREMEIVWVKLGQLNFEVTSYTDKSNRQKDMFKLTKTQSLYIVSKYNNELRAKVILRWEQLELKHQSEQKRIQQRDIARMGCPKMTDALKTQRIESGKPDAKPFHFSNEHNMIYRIVLGATAKKYKECIEFDGNLRDALTPLQIEAVSKIQDMNTTLIDLGIEYKERKKQLDAFYSKRFGKLLLDELNELTA